MKKLLLTYAKKSMSLFMACIMLLTCWVFVAPQEAEAAVAVSYSVTIKYDWASGDTGGNIKVSYYNFKDDYSGVDTGSYVTDHVLQSSMKNLATGTGKTVTYTVPGFPYEFKFEDASAGCGESNRSFVFQGLSINGVNATNNGQMTVNNETKSIKYDGTGNINTSWAVPTVNSISLNPTSATVNVPDSGTGSTNITATVKDQYGYSYHKLTDSHCTMNPQVTGISTSVSNNVITLSGTKALFDSITSYNSSNGKATSTLNVLMGSSGTKTATITFQAPQYTVSFVDAQGTRTQNAYYKGSVTDPGARAQAPDNNYHYAFTSWNDTVFTNITANKTITANYSKTAHDFSGEWVYNGDGTHSKKCTGCEVVGYNGKAYADGGYLECTGEWTGSDSNHSMSCTTCKGTPSHTPQWQEKVDVKYMVTEQSCTTDGVYKKSCSICGLAHSTDTFISGKATGHNYSMKGETKGHTCTENGYVIYWCSCGSFINDEYKRNDDGTYVYENGEKVLLDPAAHTWNPNISMKDANEHGQKCDKCDAWTAVEAHNWTLADTDITKAPTCQEAGEGLYRCSCGATKTDTIAIDPNAHSYSSAVSNNDGTHTAVCENGCGQDVKDPCVDEDNNCECDVCGYNFPHDYQNLVVAENRVSVADCNSYAVYKKSCSVCGDVSNETFEDVNGGYGAHNWDDTETFLKSEAKCEIDAVYYYECLECGKSSEEVDGATWTKAGSALVHEATDVLIPTTDGKHAYKCVRYDDCKTTLNETDCTYVGYADNGNGTHTGACACGDTFTEEHKMTNWESDNKEGAVAGTQSRHCEVCDYAENEQTCTYVEDESKYVAPTCMTVGGRTYICSDCGHGYSIVLPIDENNHTGNNHFENAVAPTCNAKGYEGDIICECGVEVGKGKTLDEDPNNHGDNETKVEGAVTATCTIRGNTGTVICLGCDEIIENGRDLGLDPDNHVEKTTHDGLAPTCEADGYTAYETCNACHKELGKTVLTKLGHNYNGDAVILDGDVHAYKCERFDECASTGVGTEKDATEVCSGGEASCTAKAECSVCGDTYGELAMHVFEGEYKQVEGKDEHYRKCLSCDAYGLGTTYEVGESEACSGGEATCTEKAECELCGMEYGEALGHDFTGDVVTLEGNQHAYTCKNGCEEIGVGTVVDATEACVDSDPEVIAPTCTTAGYTQHECDICDNEWTTDTVAALGHDYTEKLIDDAHKISDADCVTDEVYWYDCSRCDKNAKDEEDTEKYTELTFINTPAYGHKFDGNTEFLYKATDATCTAHETYYVYCSVCKESSKGVEGKEATFIKYGTMLPHTYAEIVDEEDLSKNRKSEATCTEAAVYYKSCSVCGAQSTETFTYGEVKGHVFTEKIMDAAHRITTANCVTAATYWYDCANCNQNAALIDQSEMTEEQIAALKYTDGDKAPNTHTSLKNIPFQAATCTVDGHSAYQYCEGCEAEIGKVTVGYEAKGHDFNGTPNHIEGTDTHNFKCLNCDAYGIGKGVKEEGENKTIACIFGDWAHVEGTLTHSQACECGNEKTEECEDSDPTVVPPTCTADGYTAHECDVCGYEWTTDPTTKLEHAYPETWTSNGDGTHSKVCANNCGEDITEDCSGGEATCANKAVCDVCEGEYGETTDHKFETYKPSAPAQCGVNAMETAKCEYCDATDTREIAGTALKHSMGDYVVTKDPTCMAEGEETSYCQNTWIIDGKEVKCTHSTTRVIPADSSAHVTGEWITDSGAGDCLSGIRYYKICEVCKEVVEEKTETGNHNWEVKVNNKPTCVSDGYILYECSVCFAPKKEYPEGYEALGHDWGEEIIVKAASCANEGRAYQLCDRCGKKGDEYKLAKLAHGPKFDEAGKLLNATEVIIVDPVSATCTTKGHNGYWKCLNCSYDEHLDPNSAYEEYPTIAHTDSNNDGYCDTCNGKMYNDGDSSGSCKCICHKNNWFMQIFYKIFRFFWKLFRINKTCDCGFVHY